MIDLNNENKERCIGCEACKEVCPVFCIEMKYDDEGFLFPYIDKEKCIECKKCESVCAVYKKVNLDLEKIKKETEVFAVWNLNEPIRKESSSGGFFSVLAERILEEKGIVIGAVFNKKFQVIHDFIEKKEELYKLRGSKYVQSSINNTYSLTRENLKKGRKVLYSGTPCQIEGLYNFLGKDYENLITCGIVCHGVPSPKVFETYLEQLKKIFKEEIKEIKFREKINGWRDFNFSIFFKSGKKYSEKFNKNYYCNGFSQNLYLRKSCYKCNYKLNSDFLIGDFWGIELSDSNLDDNKGISLVILRSLKAKIIFNSLKKKLFFKENSLEKSLIKNPNILEAAFINISRDDFYKDYNKKGFEYVLNKYLENDIKRLKFANFLYRLKRKIKKKLFK